jgi:hypothetical protein
MTITIGMSTNIIKRKGWVPTDFVFARNVENECHISRVWAVRKKDVQNAVQRC